jgi:hypothetical protein
MGTSASKLGPSVAVNKGRPNGTTKMTNNGVEANRQPKRSGSPNTMITSKVPTLHQLCAWYDIKEWSTSSLPFDIWHIINQYARPVQLVVLPAQPQLFG